MRDPKATGQARWGFIVILVMLTLSLIVLQALYGEAYVLHLTGGSEFYTESNLCGH